jgi:hypothetical protein
MKMLRCCLTIGLVFLICFTLATPASAASTKKVILAPTWDLGQPVRVALLPVEAEKGKEEGARLVCRALYGQLLSIPEFRLIEPVAVDTLLREAGLLDRDAWENAAPEQLGRVLNVDFLLFPKLTDWHQRYLLLQSSTAVGIRARMVDVRTGKPAWEAECKSTFAKGLTGLPTGASSLALEPLRGMSKRYLFDSAQDAARGLVECLQPVEPAQRERRSKPTAISGPPEIRTKKREESLPVVPAPPSVTSASMSFQDGILTVELEGTPDCSGSISIGETDRLFPLSESSRGHYRGQYRLPPGAPDPSYATVRLVRPNGQAATGEVR